MIKKILATIALIFLIGFANAAIPDVNITNTPSNFDRYGNVIFTYSDADGTANLNGTILVRDILPPGTPNYMDNDILQFNINNQIALGNCTDQNILSNTPGTCSLNIDFAPTPTGNYYIGIDLSDGVSSDLNWSSHTSNITFNTPTVTVVSPNGGETIDRYGNVEFNYHNVYGHNMLADINVSNGNTSTTITNDLNIDALVLTGQCTPNTSLPANEFGGVCIINTDFGLTNGNNYRVVVELTETFNNKIKVNDQSDNTLTFNGAQPAENIIFAPLGQENLSGMIDINFSVRTDDTSATLNIDLNDQFGTLVPDFNLITNLTITPGNINQIFPHGTLTCTDTDNDLSTANECHFMFRSPDLGQRLNQPATRRFQLKGTLTDQFGTSVAQNPPVNGTPIFEIFPPTPPVLNVTAPTGGQSLSETINLTFDLHDLYDKNLYLTINLYDDNATLVQVLDANMLVQAGSNGTYTNGNLTCIDTDNSLATANSCTYTFDASTIPTGYYTLEYIVFDDFNATVELTPEGNDPITGNPTRIFQIAAPVNPTVNVTYPYGGLTMAGVFDINFTVGDGDDNDVNLTIYLLDDQQNIVYTILDHYVLSATNMNPTSIQNFTSQRTGAQETLTCTDPNGDQSFATVNNCTYSFDSSPTPTSVLDGNYFVRVHVSDAYTDVNSLNPAGTSADGSFTIVPSVPPEIAITYPTFGTFIEEFDINFTVRDIDDTQLTYNLYFVDATTGQRIRTILENFQAQSGTFTTTFTNPYGYQETLTCIDRDNDGFTGANECTYTVHSFPTNGDVYIELLVSDQYSDVNTMSNMITLLNRGINFINLNPQPDGYTNRINGPIEITIIDGNNTPLDLSTIDLTVYGFHFDVNSPNITFNVGTGELSYVPSTAFNNGEIVNVTITAGNILGESNTLAYSFTVDTTPTDPIDNLQAIYDGNAESVRLTWGEPTYTGAPPATYNIYRGLFQIEEEDKSQTLVATGVTGLTYTDTSIGENTTYYYAVTTTDAAGNESNLSNNSSVTTGTFARDPTQGTGTTDGNVFDAPQTIEARLGDLVFVEFLQDKVYIQPGDNTHLDIILTNLEKVPVCVEIDADLKDGEDYAYLDVELPKSMRDSYGSLYNASAPGVQPIGFKNKQNIICLSANQQQIISINIKATPDAPTTEYDIEVELEAAEFTLTQDITVDVVDPNDIQDIDFLDSQTIFQVCRGDYTPIELEIESDKDEDDVMLYAYHPVLAPRFEPSEINLHGGDSRFVDLVIHTNKTTKLGIHEIEVFAENEDRTFFIKRRVKIQVIDCGDQPYFLTVPNIGLSLASGDVTEVVFYLTNRTNQPQRLHLVEKSDLQTRIDEPDVYLPPKGTYKGIVYVTGRDRDKAGDHTIELYASSMNEGEKGQYRKVEVLVNVPQGNAPILQNENLLTQETGSLIERYPYLPKNVRREIEAPRTREERLTGFVGLLPTSAVGWGFLVLIIIFVSFFVNKIKQMKENEETNNMPWRQRRKKKKEQVWMAN